MDAIMELAGNRAAFIGLAVIGFAACGARGIGPIAQSGSWWSVQALLGYGLGVLALIVIAAGLMGRDLPFISGERAAFFALLAIIAAKFGVGVLYRAIG